MAARGHDVDERLTGVAFLEELLEVEVFRHARVQGRVNTADERREMRREDKPHLPLRRLRQALADLRPVAVPRYVVRGEIIRSLGKGERKLGLASRTAHAG